MLTLAFVALEKEPKMENIKWWARKKASEAANTCVYASSFSPLSSISISYLFLLALDDLQVATEVVPDDS